ncbi:pyrimidine/purine nucleoside phosphorylase [candidate division WOR-3 bacterium]|nr:pyrimidine/purine nucleoside phosphorylase [candidate division WOR-3 bacterium]
MIKVNEYFEGMVKSLGPETQEKKFTLGVIMPGSYEFTTGVKELMEIVQGSLEIHFEGHPAKEYPKGQNFTVPENTKFTVKAEKPTAYICYYG